MARNFDKTRMGGDGERFRTTCWDILEAVKAEDENQKQIILGNLLDAYWKPVYCYLRRKGYSNESAKDLTQGFFTEVVLSRNLIAGADKTKGRFRTFLLTALDNYTANVYHHDTAAKRRPKEGISSLNAFENADNNVIPSDISPEDVFNYIWASDLLDSILKRVENECCDTNKEIHWKVFHDKVLLPFLGKSQQSSLSDICKKYGIESPSKASNMIVTVKRRFNTILKQTLRSHVNSDWQVEEEFNELINILSKTR